MLVVIKGAGDLASGVAVRLTHAGIRVVMTDLQNPTAIRRTVSFCRAIWEQTATVEDVTALLVQTPEEARAVVQSGRIAVMADERASCVTALGPDAVIDAILAKRNTGTALSDAPIVVALGPGFTAGEDCHAVVETMRGHDLGRVYFRGAALPNTGVPGSIAGKTEERILRAPCGGIWQTGLDIGSRVSENDVVATVGGQAVRSKLCGVVRGLLRDGTSVGAGMKCGDVDPRGVVSYCETISDKARAIGGGVLEALLALSEVLK